MNLCGFLPESKSNNMVLKSTTKTKKEQNNLHQKPTERSRTVSEKPMGIKEGIEWLLAILFEPLPPFSGCLSSGITA
ncbi:hypothetical protein HYU22_00100 [Candidatus Woesearchaeota archaeon]|nr:hypothetical protein [Candidatus Woesearchaeota archaeon]